MVLISTRIPEDMEEEIKWYAEKEKIGRTIALRKILDKGLKEFRLEYALEQLASHNERLAGLPNLQEYPFGRCSIL